MHLATDMTSQLEQGVVLIEHGLHIAVFGVILVLSMMSLLFLVRFFVQPVASRALRAVIYSRARELLGHGGQTRNAQVMEVTETRERETFIVIPDISGYTRFVHLNRFSSGHARYVVSKLLQSLIEAASPVLNPMGIAGDAVLFQAVSIRDDEQLGVAGSQVGKTVVDLITAYYRMRAELRHDNACLCEVCRHIDDLELKVIVHRGPTMHYRLDHLEDLMGLPVIMAHRLLKNSTGRNRYILMTDAAAEDITLPFVTAAQRHTEYYDGLGEIALRVHDFEPDALIPDDNADQHSLGLAQFKDAFNKLGENAATLRRAVGSSSPHRADERGE